MAKNPGAKDSSGKYSDPAAAIKAGLMQKKTGEFMSPGKAVAKVVAKVAGKTAAKKAATTTAKKAAQIASNSVKPVKAGPAYANKFNQGSMMRTTDAATGAAARKGAARLGVTGTKGAQPPVKINSAVKKTETKANARALKAAQGPSLAKGARKAEASSGAYERKIVKITAGANKEKGLSRKEAYAKASKTQDERNAISIAESKKILARRKAEENAKSIAKATKKKGK